MPATKVYHYYSNIVGMNYLFYSCLQYLQDTLHNFIVDLIDHKQDCEVHCQNTEIILH